MQRFILATLGLTLASCNFFIPNPKALLSQSFLKNHSAPSNITFPTSYSLDSAYYIYDPEASSLTYLGTSTSVQVDSIRKVIKCEYFVNDPFDLSLYLLVNGVTQEVTTYIPDF